MYASEGTKRVDLSVVGTAIGNVASISPDRLDSVQRAKLCSVLHILADQDDRGTLEKKDVVVIHPIETPESAIRHEAMRLVQVIENFSPFTDTRFGTVMKEREEEFSKKHVELKKNLQDWKNSLMSAPLAQELEKRSIFFYDSLINLYHGSLKQDLSLQFKDKLLSEIKLELQEINQALNAYFDKGLKEAKELVEQEGQAFLDTNYEEPKEFHEYYRSYRKSLANFNLLGKRLQMLIDNITTKAEARMNHDFVTILRENKEALKNTHHLTNFKARPARGCFTKGCFSRVTLIEEASLHYKTVLDKHNPNKEGLDHPQKKGLHQPSESAKMLGHVLGGFMISDLGDLEGSNQADTMNYMLEFIQHHLKDPNIKESTIKPLLKFQKELNHSLGFAQEVKELQSQIKEAYSDRAPPKAQVEFQVKQRIFIQKTLSKLDTLPPGESILLSGGWTGALGEDGHAMLYRFEKNLEGTFDLTIINTGAGTNTHDHLVEASKRKFNPVRRFSRLNIVSGEIDEKLLTSFLEKELLPLTPNGARFNEGNIYGVEVERLKFKETPTLQLSQAYITGQRSGNCAYKSVIIAARLALGVNDYKIFKHSLELRALSEGIQKLQQGAYKEKDSIHVIHILQRASKKMMASTLKLRKKNLLNSTEARDAYNIAKHVLEAVENYRQHPFKISRHMEAQIYSTEALKDALANRGAKLTIPKLESHVAEQTTVPPPEILEIMTGSPQESLMRLHSSALNLAKVKSASPYRSALVSNILNQLDYTAHTQMWDLIAADDHLRMQAMQALQTLVDNLRPEYGLSSFIEEYSIFLEQPASLVNIFNVSSLLAHHQWRKGSLAPFGISATPLLTLKSECQGFDAFSPSFEKNLEILQQNCSEKYDLFPLVKQEIKVDFTNKEDFEKFPFLVFFEAFLKEHPELEKKVEISKEMLSSLDGATPGLGIGLEQRMRRLRAILILSKSEKIEAIHLSPDYQAFKMLLRVNEAFQATTNAVNPSQQYFCDDLHTSYFSVRIKSNKKLNRIQNFIENTFTTLQHPTPIGPLYDDKGKRIRYTYFEPIFDEDKRHVQQNYTLTKYSDLDRTAETEDARELLVAISEKDVQISHLIDLYEKNPSLLKNPIYQKFLRSYLLEEKLLFEQIAAEPKLAERVVNFLKVSFQTIPSKTKTAFFEEINKQVFIMVLTQKIMNYISQQKSLSPDLDPSKSETISQFENDLQKIRTKQREVLIYSETLCEETWLKSFLNYAILYSDPLFEKDPLETEESQALLMRVASAQSELNKLGDVRRKDIDPNYKNYFDRQIQQEVLNLLVSKGSILKTSLGQETAKLCQQFAMLHGYPDIAPHLWKGEFPKYIADHSTGSYEVNLLMGSVSVIREDLSSLEILQISKNYQQLFDKKIPLNWVSYGLNGFETNYRGHTIKSIVDEKRKSAEFMIEQEGISYILQSTSSQEALPLPASLKRDTLAWLAPASSDLALVIFDSSMQYKIAEVMKDGTIREGRDGIDKKGGELKPRVFVEMGQTSFKEMASFRRPHLEAWGHDNQLDVVNYRNLSDETGQSLSFVADKEGKLCWGKDPSFFIATEQFLDLLRGYDDYLLLQNSKGERLLILPREVDVNKTIYSAIPLSKSGELKPSNTLQQLQAVEILFKKGDYARAIHHLISAREPRPYTFEERTIIKRLLEIKRGDPWACLVRIYAANQVIENINLTPPSMRSLTSEEMNFWEKDTLNGMVKDYNSFVANRNVPKRYHPDKIMGIDRELRLLKKLWNHQLTKNLEFPLQLNEYAWKAASGRYSSEQGRAFSGDSVEFPKGPADLTEKELNALVSEFKAILNPYSDENQAALKQPDSLNLPGKHFQRNFANYYAEAISDDPAVRNNLKDRIAFMRFGDKTSFNDRLANILLRIIDAKKDASSTIPLLPDWSANKSFNEQLQKFINSKVSPPRDFSSQKSSFEKELEGQLKKLLQWSAHIPFAPIEMESGYQAISPFPQITNAALIPQRPNFKQLIMRPSFFSKTISKYVVPKQAAPSNASLLKETKAVVQRLSDSNQKPLPQYVVDKLFSLEQLVREGSSDKIPSYTLREGITYSDLETGFQQEIDNNTPEIANLKLKIERLANRKSGDTERDLELDLLQGSGLQEPWGIENCLAAFLNNQWESFASQEPHLTPIEIDTLHSFIVEFLITTIHTQRAERGLKLLKELEEAKGNAVSEKNLKEEIGTLLVAHSTYDINDSPALLIFEYASGWTISPAQAEMLKALFDKDSQGNFQDVILQLIMGGGKSTVISPIQAKMKADGEHLSLLVSPDSLFETQRGNNASTSRKLFGQFSGSLEFSREDNNVEYLETLLYTMQEAITHKEYLNTRPKDLLCLKLEHWECRSQIERIENEKRKKLSEAKDNPDAPQESGQSNAEFAAEIEWKKKGALLKKILDILKNQGCATFDEADTIFQCKYQVNFTLGVAKPAPKEAREVISEIYYEILANPNLRSIVRLHQNRQSLMTDAQVEEVKISLLETMVDRLIKNYHLPIDPKLLSLYCEGSKSTEAQAIFEILMKLYQTDNPKLKEGIRKIGALKFEMESLLKDTLKKTVDTHLGLSKERPKIGLAIPYRANNTPSETAEFANPCETINKTFQVFGSGWRIPEQTVQFLSHLRQKIVNYRELGNEREATSLVNQFKEATGVDLYAPLMSEDKMIEIITPVLDRLLKQDEPHSFIIAEVLDFVTAVPLALQLKTYPNQLNGTTQDLGGMVGTSQGYTGTTGPKHSFPTRFSCLENTETDREVSRTLLEEKTPVIEIEHNEPATLLETLFKGKANGSQFRAFIDTGALFTAKNNIEVANSMMQYFANTTVKGVIFWDDKINTPTLLYLEHGLLKTHSLKGTSREDLEEDCKTLKLDRNQLFTYYDQNHIVGADLYYDSSTRAFMTVGSQTNKDKMFQGGMRMRKLIKREQHIEILIQKKEMEKMSSTLKQDPKDPLFIKEDPLFIKDVIVHTELIQAFEELSDNGEATKEMMQRAIKDLFDDKSQNTKTEESSQYWFKFLQPFVEQPQGIDPFLEYGNILTKANVITVLNNYKASLILQVETLIQAAELHRYPFENTSITLPEGSRELLVLLDGQLTKIIDRQMNNQCLPDELTNEAVLNREVQRQTLAEQNQLSEQNLEQNRNREMERNRQNVQHSGKKQSVQELPWSVDDPFNLKVPLFQGNVPPVFPLTNLLSKEEGRDLISQDILLSKHFVQTEMNTEEGLFNSPQKGICDILVIEEQGQIKAMILTSKEAAFFRKKLAEQTPDGPGPFRNLWLMNPHGAVVQSGAISWDKFPDINGSKKYADRLLLQTLILSGDIARINQHLPALKEWIYEKDLTGPEIQRRKAQIHGLLNKAIANSIADQNKLSLSRELQALLS